MVGVTKIQRGNAGYWIEAVAEGGEDYYTKPGEVPGEWVGGLAADIGLSGQVDRDAYTAILAGTDPTSGDQLLARPAPRSYTDKAGRQRTADPVLGYDVRFAAPKSVSLLYGVGEPAIREAILRAHDEAVAQGMSYLEDNACLVQRGRNGVVIEPGEGLVAMGFRHRMSRAGDPALHTHVVVSNLTRAVSDGRWLTLASPKGRSPFYLHAKAAGFVYQAALRRAVARDLGLSWGLIRNGHGDLSPFARDVIEHFSQRRMEIVEDMAKRGTTSARAAEVSAYRTRDAKDYGVDEDTRREEWIAKAGEFDLSPQSIDTMVAQGSPRAAAAISTDNLGTALQKLETTKSHFDRRDLICALADQLPDGAAVGELTAAADRVLGSEHVVRLNVPANLITPTYYSTPRLWAQEQRFIEIARSGEDAGAGVASAGVLESVLARHDYLGTDQRAMVARLLTGGERVVPVAALPGTGKTTALAAAREGWEAAGHEVRGVATARTASAELQDAGVPATSIRALLMNIEDWESRGVEPLPAGTIILMDESTTTQTDDMAELAAAVARCGGKLVAIGDPKQIGAVGPGGSYGHLTREVDPIVLRRIRRQRSASGRRIVELAHEGRGSDALDVMRSQGQLVIGDTLPEVLDALALDWRSAYGGGEDAMMIARRNRDVADLNERARALLKEGGLLPREDELIIDGQGFAVGEAILTRVNSSHVSNRERWSVTRIDTAKREVEVQRIGGDERSAILDTEYLARRTNSEEPAIQPAYALTTFAAQGKTFDSSYALLDAGASQEEFVVFVSRSRGPTVGYGVAASELTDPEYGPGLRELEDELHELRAGSERPADEFISAELAIREQLGDLDLPELFARRAYVEAQLRASTENTPTEERLAALDERIAEVAEQLAHNDDLLMQERSRRRPDPEALGRLGAVVDQGHEQYESLKRERDDLTASIPSARDRQVDPDLPIERALIEERLSHLQRREIQMERMETTPMVENVLGPRPGEPVAADLWNEGVNLIYSNRYKESNPIRTGRALGPEPLHGSTRYTEHLAAQRRLDEIRTQLGIEDTPTRSLDNELTIEL